MANGNPSVAVYALRQLAGLGINHIFGVPGDYAFGIDDSVELVPELEWVACANELNAAYAADGYARERGVAVLTTTFGVGECSALNGVMGSRTHRLPVFHLVGCPSERIQRQGLVTHHSYGDARYDRFVQVSGSACCVTAYLTPDNAVYEMDRVIREALRQSMPAYIQISELAGRQTVLGVPKPALPLAHITRQASDAQELEAALTEVLDRLAAAKNPVALVESLVTRYGVADLVTQVIARANLGFATPPNGKATLDETMPQYLGLYNGELSQPKDVIQQVEGADLVIALGGLVTCELNCGAWSIKLDPARLVTINDNWVKAGDKVFTPVAIEDMLKGLAARVKPVASTPVSAVAPHAVIGQPSDRVTSANLYPRLLCALRSGDTLVVETGTCMLHVNSMQLPQGVRCQNQTVWGSIGWATPATLGVALAKISGRTWLVTGDGSHQLTYNEIAVMGRYQIDPVIIVLNNGIYGIEYIVAEPTKHAYVYNTLAPVVYHKIPEAMGCKNWLTRRVTTVAELDTALADAVLHKGAVYLDVAIPPEESQAEPAALFNRQYQLATPNPA